MPDNLESKSHPAYPHLEPELCLGCQSCWPACPTGALGPGLSGQPMPHPGLACIECGHCQAACPTGAISLTGLAAPGPTLFQLDQTYLPPGARLITPPDLARLMASRRSIRNYRPEPLELSLLSDLATMADLAPSAGNRRTLTYCLINDPARMKAASAGIIEFYRRLCAMSEKGWLRLLTRAFGNPALSEFYRHGRPLILAGLKKYRENGRDFIFHKAPAAVVINSAPGALRPVEDASMAAQNLLLAAHVLGLGSCLIGLAVAAAQKDEKIKQLLGIPPGDTARAVITLGYPAEDYYRLASRKPVNIRKNTLDAAAEGVPPNASLRPAPLEDFAPVKSQTQSDPRLI